MKSTVKVAAAQATPVFLDRKATTDKACDLIKEAAQNGAKLIVFPEAFIPCYPDWVWVIPPGKKALTNQVYKELIENSVSIPDKTTKKLCAAAKKNKIFVVMGINERNSESSNSTLYNTLLYIDDHGKIMGKHRKLVPTMGERLLWGGGDGSTLTSFDTSFGKLGGLICWENYMPLARYSMYGSGVQIYVASTWDYGEVWQSSLRHIAKEGGMFVIGCCTVMKMDDIPEKYEFKKLYASNKVWINPGESCIIAPNGNYLVPPVKNKEEILYADLDLSLIAETKWQIDTAGHYARPDVFNFKVNRGEIKETNFKK